MMQQIVASKKRSAIRKRSRKRWLFYSVARKKYQLPESF